MVKKASAFTLSWEGGEILLQLGRCFLEVLLQFAAPSRMTTERATPDGPPFLLNDLLRPQKSCAIGARDSALA